MEGFAEGYAVGADTGRNNMNNCGGMGGDWMGMLVLLALVGNRGGIGGIGGGYGGGYGSGCGCGCGCGKCCNGDNGYNLGKVATHEDLTNVSILNKEDTIIQGQFGLQQSLCSGFAGVTAAITQNGFNNQMCCCEINRNIDAVRYETAKNTGEIINAGNYNTQRLLDFMTNNKMEDYRDKIQSLQYEVSQKNQNEYLESKLKPCPVPAYITCNPYAPTPYYPPYAPAPFYGNNCGHKNDCNCSPCGNGYGVV